MHYLVDAAWMAAENLEDEESNAIKAVLNIAVDKLKGARERLDAALYTPA